MTSPSIIQGFSLDMVGPLFLAFLTAWFFWRNVVPRQLRGLQVAFPTGEKTYEVHKVTSTVQDVRLLLARRGTRLGVVSYLMALTGSLVLLFEFFNYRGGGSAGYHAPSVAFALILIVAPAIISSGTSLGAQVIKPLGVSRATLQSNSNTRNASYMALTLAWLALAVAIGEVLKGMGTSKTTHYSVMALVAFSPAVLAYGRILGSSWHALKQSSSQIAQGGASPFHNHLPNARQQFIAQVVHLNLVAMPFVAVNTLISLVLLAYNPDMFVHSDRVLELPEYRIQTTYMEEGGLLGFGLIELFSHIPQAGIRVPIVTTLLLFLLLNVAAIGFLFVYEVARILFLDIQDVSGWGGIRLADSRLLRAEPIQQANVLNFCFTGFAGQSMLLLALAMVTFWDSSFLPQGDACGAWESSVCSVLQKDMLEQLTWMLASGGQVAFLMVWVVSRRRSTKLSEIVFDASMDEDRTRLRGMSDMIYLKQRPTSELLGKDDWNTAIERFDDATMNREATLVGLDMIRHTQAKMLLYCGLGRWDEAEELAVDLLALQGGRDAQIARLVLCATSLAQRDYKEAIPRLELLDNDDVEAVRIRWVTSLLSGQKHLSKQGISMISVDPLRKDNIRMLQAFEQGETILRATPPRQPAQRAMYLSQLARMRMAGESERALNHLERTLAGMEGETWAHAELVAALLNHDSGRTRSAENALKTLAKQHPRHPHIRAVLHQFAQLGRAERPPSEPTKIHWILEREANWRASWNLHNVAIPPIMDSTELKRHAVQANAWSLMLGSNVSQHSKKNIHKSLETEVPLGLFTHLQGITVTIGGMPVDLGLPAGINLKAAEKNGLLEM